MDKSDIIVIGGVAAGPKTAATAVRRVPTAKVTLFQRDEHISYSSCGLPYFASGDLGSFQQLTMTPYGVPRDAAFFKNSRGFEAVTGAEVIDIDRNNKVVTVRRLATGETFQHGYDKLVLATGAAPIRPTFQVHESDRIGTFHTPADAIAFRKLAEQGKIDQAAIIGGGFIGCELAEAIGGLWGIEITLIEKESRLLPAVLDPEMAALVRHEFRKQDIAVITEGHVEKIAPDGNGRPVVSLRGRGPIATDYVFLTLGVRPEVTLAEQCGLRIGPSGGILVDRRMRTSDPDIYAGGDCVESINRITTRPLHLPMGSLANRHGRVIAENLAGGDMEFSGVVGTFVLKLFETCFGAVGLTQKEACDAGYEVGSVWGTFTDKPDYQPDVKTIVLKMVYAKDTERLLGLQASGPGDICRRLDVFASFLQNQSCVHCLFDFEHAYTPAFSDALDPLHHLAAMAVAQQRGVRFMNPGSICEAATQDDLIVLDVRQTEETENKPLPEGIAGSRTGVVHIPLSEITSRLTEIDPARRVLVVCQRGSRSYQAALMLKAAGFENVEILAGGLQALPR